MMVVSHGRCRIGSGSHTIGRFGFLTFLAKSLAAFREIRAVGYDPNGLSNHALNNVGLNREDAAVIARHLRRSLLF